MEQVEKFCDQLIDAKGYTTLDGEVRKQLIVDMTQRLMDQIDRAAIEALPEDKAVELAELIDKDDFTQNKLAEFMQNSGVDLRKVTLETMLQFRALYLGNAAKRNGR